MSPLHRVLAIFSMLVSVFGLGTAGVVLGERINAIEFSGCLLVLVGVIIASRISNVKLSRPTSTWVRPT